MRHIKEYKIFESDTSNEIGSYLNDIGMHLIDDGFSYKVSGISTRKIKKVRDVNYSLCEVSISNKIPFCGDGEILDAIEMTWSYMLSNGFSTKVEVYTKRTYTQDHFVDGLRVVQTNPWVYYLGHPKYELEECVKYIRWCDSISKIVLKFEKYEVV